VRKLKTRLAADVDRHRVHVRLCVPRPRRCISRPSLWDTPPNAFARDHGWRQVSWLAGRRLGPPSQGQDIPSGIHGLRLAAYSCGGSCGIASVPDAHRIPFYIPCGHHRQRCLHRAAGESRTRKVAAVCKPRSRFFSLELVAFPWRSCGQPKRSRRGNAENHAEQHLVKFAQACDVDAERSLKQFRNCVCVI
jgi:hypothetical protein